MSLAAKKKKDTRSAEPPRPKTKPRDEAPTQSKRPPLLAIDPPELVVEPGGHAVVTITNRSDQSAKIMPAITAGARALSVTPSKLQTLEPGASVQLEVKRRPHPRSTRPGRLTIRGTIGSFPEIPIHSAGPGARPDAGPDKKSRPFWGDQVAATTTTAKHEVRASQLHDEILDTEKKGSLWDDMVGDAREAAARDADPEAYERVDEGKLLGAIDDLFDALADGIVAASDLINELPTPASPDRVHQLAMAALQVILKGVEGIIGGAAANFLRARPGLSGSPLVDGFKSAVKAGHAEAVRALGAADAGGGSNAGSLAAAARAGVASEKQRDEDRREGRPVYGGAPKAFFFRRQRHALRMFRTAVRNNYLELLPGLERVERGVQDALVAKFSEHAGLAEPQQMALTLREWVNFRARLAHGATDDTKRDVADTDNLSEAKRAVLHAHGTFSLDGGPVIQRFELAGINPNVAKTFNGKTIQQAGLNVIVHLEHRYTVQLRGSLVLRWSPDKKVAVPHRPTPMDQELLIAYSRGATEAPLDPSENFVGNRQRLVTHHAIHGDAAVVAGARKIGLAVANEKLGGLGGR